MYLLFNYFSNTLNSESAFSETILVIEISWKKPTGLFFSPYLTWTSFHISCSCFLKILWYHIILLMNPNSTSLDLTELKFQIHLSIYPLGNSFIHSTNIYWVPTRWQGMGYILRLTWTRNLLSGGEEQEIDIHKQLSGSKNELMIFLCKCLL